MIHFTFCKHFISLWLISVNSRQNDWFKKWYSLLSAVKILIYLSYYCIVVSIMLQVISLALCIFSITHELQNLNKVFCIIQYHTMSYNCGAFFLQYADHDGQIGWTLITLETQEAPGTTNRVPPNSPPTTTSVTVATSPKWSVTLYPWRLRRNPPGKSWCVLPVKDSCAMTPITSRFRAGTTRSGIIVIVVRQTIGSSFINLL